MTLLLIGKNGQVGWELQRTLQPLGPVRAMDYPEVDFADLNALRRLVREAKPSLIVNAAAYTAVDKAESETDKARAVNTLAPGLLAEEAQRLGIPLIHYSTDYVYDGSGETPRSEDTATGPLGFYGQTKLEGDQAIAASGCAHLIFRTSWVYGVRGSNFMLTMLRLAREREELRVVSDQIGAPTWSRLIAQVTATALARCWQPGQSGGVAERSGVYHLVSAGFTSWHGFAQAIFENDSRRMEHKLKTLVPIATEEYPTPARRPKNSRLDCGKIKRVFGIHLPDWREALLQVLEP